MARVARWIGTPLLLVLLVVIGKACQYGAVERFGARYGFAAASLIGLLPFVTAMVAMRHG